jgi:pilus assembly protein CpaC
VSTLRRFASIAVTAACFGALAGASQSADAVPANPAEPKPAVTKAAEPRSSDEKMPEQEPASTIAGKLMVTVGMSITIDSPLNIQRIYIANDTLAEAVAITPKEVLITGKGPGVTTLITWQLNGLRQVWELTVRTSPIRLEAVRQQIAREFPAADINVTMDNDVIFVRGSVKDVVSADRVMSIASTLGRAVNLLRVDVPAVEPQILLKVRFADVDRSASRNLGVNFANGSFNTTSAIGTGFPISTDGAQTFSVSNVVNILLARKDINLVAAIQALESKNLLQTLAEPNVMATNGKPASFLAGGEYPYPMIQPSAGAATVTIAFKEYGVRLNFLPNVTPRGTIHLTVTPEVSSLDFTNSVTIEGFTIPGLSTRRVSTDVELESGQSFVIAGLLDKQVQESFSRIPGIGSIPVLGKLFQTKQTTKNNSELLVIITPEIVRPIPQGQPVPELNFTTPFLPNTSKVEMRQPGIDKTGPVPTHPPTETIPVEQLVQQQRQGQQGPAPTMQQMQQQQPYPNGPITPLPGQAPPAAPVKQDPGGPSK